MSTPTMQVQIFVESRYQVDRKRMKDTILKALGENGVNNSGEISIAIVGDRKMRFLNNKYRNLDKTTNVLSFPLREGEQTLLPEGSLHLGDIVLSYPQVIRDAASDDMLVDDKIDELLVHGLMHLLGVHHEEQQPQVI